MQRENVSYQSRTSIYNVGNIQNSIYMYTCVYNMLYACMYVCMCVCVYVCMYVCMYVAMHVCMHVCMYVCMMLAWLHMYADLDHSTAFKRCSARNRQNCVLNLNPNRTKGPVNRLAHGRHQRPLAKLLPWALGSVHSKNKDRVKFRTCIWGLC